MQFHEFFFKTMMIWFYFWVLFIEVISTRHDGSTSCCWLNWCDGFSAWLEIWENKDSQPQRRRRLEQQVLYYFFSQCSVSVARILYPTPHSSTNYFTRGASWRIQGDSSQRWSLESLLCVCSDAIVWHRGLKNKINKTLRKKKFEAINLGIRKLFKKFFWDFQKTHFLPFQKWQTNQFINSI